MVRIILGGIKHSGKSTVGWTLSSRLGLYFADLDDLILRDAGGFASVREIFRKRGKEEFQKLERASLEHFLLVNRGKSFVLSLGGGTIENPEAVELMEKSGCRTYYLEAEEKVLYERISRGGLPPFLEGPDPGALFHDMFSLRSGLYRSWADRIVDTRGKTPAEICEEIADRENQT